MKLHELSDNQGSRHARKRVGRGIGSGKGKTSGRGHKGRNPVPAPRSRDLKAVRCRCTGVCQSAVSRIFSATIM